MEERSRPQLAGRARKNTTIDSTIVHPGTIRINVEGAFIVDEEAGSPPKALKPSGTRDIRLPHHSSEVSHIAVDIGGSLAKLVYFTRDPIYEGGRLNFVNFETENIDDCIAYMGILINGQRIQQQQLLSAESNGNKKNSKAAQHDLCVMATGGGAHKYYDKICEALEGVHVYREDEMECLIVGLDFFLTEIPEEVFTYSDEDPMRFVEPSEDIYPYLLVNIGSGVSMIKVSGPQKFERIGGTSLGGGTLWGLLSLLTGARSFDEMLKLADRGDNTTVDMLVGDIYGTDYGRIGLKSTTIASTFGKVFKKSVAASPAPNENGVKENGVNGSAIVDEVDEPDVNGTDLEDRAMPSQAVEDIKNEKMKNFKAEDISRSLLYAISNNIGQIAYLHAQHHNLGRIYFGGSFIRGHRQTMNTLAYAIKFWSKGQAQAYFLRHEGYLGAVGAFLRRQPRDWGRRRSSFG
ncbi:hypothetical protein H072_9597 [Dactylellina haptotyla CBS 200.50]|uniref:Pantothenate kinase n=1 Tax=Dactylellina haptotyla (strain CBS 200.50) TaxID=1284197 RepID=S8BC69_DACHA|nr:hypothetical protein H072_9597 [Dactylellina haptotyla CBS 200.50]